MTTLTRADVARLARLARLRIGDDTDASADASHRGRRDDPDEAARLALTLDAIARDFSRLAARAETLPLPDAPPAGDLRDDIVTTTDARTVDLILAAAAPRVDPTTKALRVLDRA